MIPFSMMTFIFANSVKSSTEFDFNSWSQIKLFRNKPDDTSFFWQIYPLWCSSQLTLFHTPNSLELYPEPNWMQFLLSLFSFSCIGDCQFSKFNAEPSNQEKLDPDWCPPIQAPRPLDKVVRKLLVLLSCIEARMA